MENSNASRFWLGLILGVIGTSAVFFLINKGDALIKAEKEKPITAQQKKDQQEISFKFYKMLPELDIVVPDDIVPKPIRESLLDNAPEQTPKQTAQNKIQQQVTQQKRERLEALPGSYYLQTGSFTSVDDADRMKAKMSLLGFEVAIQNVNVNGSEYHRVRVGPIVDLELLADSKELLLANGISFYSLKAK